MNSCKLQPWQKPSYDSFGVIRLHEEILDFCNYIKPTVLETKVRELVVERVRKVITERWPSASVQVFGSFATGLYLPTSDIDIVIFGDWKTSPLRTIEKILRENDISNNIKVVDKAAVPIVKFVDKDSGINVDISFNKDNGVKTISIIFEYLEKYPPLKPLFLILKQFMLQRDLNEVFTGGIGSYCLMLLCISFLQHCNKNMFKNINLGCLLTEFFELYGRCFNFLNTGISVTGRGSYKTKYDSDQKQSLLSIDDPNDADNDVARSCYGLFNIKKAFENAYSKLYSKIIPECITLNNGSTEIPSNESILASIINVSSEMINFRKVMQIKFGFLVNHHKEKMEMFKPLKSIKRKEKRQSKSKLLSKGVHKTIKETKNNWSNYNVFENKFY